MSRWLLIFSLVLLMALSFVKMSQASDDTYVKIQEMMNDLGAPPDRAKNNGKIQNCADRGTKKITVIKSKGGTAYKGVYKNCSEYGTTRDGNVSITMGN